MKILEERKPIDIFCEAGKILSDSVIHTLGPNGSNTAIQTKEGYYSIINDGNTIIKDLTSTDPAIAPALETLKQAAFETNRKAGDGTTSTTVLMNALLQGAREKLKENSDNQVYLSWQLSYIKELLLKELDNIKQDLKDEDYEKVATVALGSDKYSKLISDAFRFLKGTDKRPKLIKKDIPGIEVNKIDGVDLDKIKIVSNLFMETKEYEDIDVVILFQPVNRFQELTQLLRKIQQTDKTTLLLYNQLSSDILENILFNYTNGAIKVIPISLAGYGKGTYSIMLDLADYCGTKVIDDVDIKLRDLNSIFFGHLDYAAINFEEIILKTQKKVKKNYLHFDEKSIIIYTGGTNIIEREEVYRRLEDAINSLGNAIDYGIVEGAGYTYSKLISNVKSNNLIGIPDFVIDSMNLIKNQIGVKDTTGIYDSATVIKEVINNAFSIVSQVITTNVVIHENIR